jgi:bifunctional DNase/RNase
MFHKLFVEAVLLDPISEQPILILKTDGGDRVLPIWIGPSEAQAIVLELQAISPPRPMTHDLLCNVIKSLAGKLTRVDICDLKDNTFYAELIVKKGNEVVRIDARPSDAVALAVRFKTPIYVAERVLSEASHSLNSPSLSNSLEKWFSSLSVEDFGKYKM